MSYLKNFIPEAIDPKVKLTNISKAKSAIIKEYLAGTIFKGKKIEITLSNKSKHKLEFDANLFGSTVGYTHQQMVDILSGKTTNLTKDLKEALRFFDKRIAEDYVGNAPFKIFGMSAKKEFYDMKAIKIVVCGVSVLG